MIAFPTNERRWAFRTLQSLALVGLTTLFALQQAYGATPQNRTASAAAATPARTTTPSAAQSLAEPKEVRPLAPLGSGDVVNVQVYGRPELNTTTSVDDDGTVAVPLAGAVAVAGLSPNVAAQKIAAAYKSGQYLRNPQVTVLVTQSRSQLVSVLGEVRTPGRFPVESRSTVLDLLAQAGGTTERSGNVLYLVRPNDAGEMERRTIDLRGLQDHRYSLKVLTLQGGDSVFVPSAEQFYIYGEVQAPNMYRLESGMTVLQAISRSGGLTKVGSSNRIEIKRRNDTGQLVSRKAKLDEQVLADDVIHVKEGLF